ncbi:hypothetical protein RAA17_24830 [Komagataeibacter rhaeticus]|nr:hypothetical protein [Komagataeibacter rhaeticus]
MSFQLNLFGTTALADTQNDLFWGELEGEDGTSPVSPVTPAPMALPQIDFHMVADRGLADTWKQRARDNALAIALLKEIEEADRNASSPNRLSCHASSALEQENWRTTCSHPEAIAPAQAGKRLARRSMPPQQTLKGQD